MSEQWYYRLMGEEFGPVSEAALRDLLGEGTVGTSDDVRRLEDEQWQKAGEVELSAAARADDTLDMSDLDSMLAAPSTAPAADARGTGDSAASDLDAMLAPSTPSRRKPIADEWYYRVSGQRFGPFDFDTLFERALAGQFSRYDEILSPGADEWVEAQTIVGLFSDEAVDLDAMLVDEQPLPASASPGKAPVKKEWYYRVLNQEMGPVDFEGLFDLVVEGNLRPDDDIRESDQTEWQRADSLVGLFPDDLSDDVDTSPPDSAEQAATPDEDDEWYFKMDDQELGPVTFERLVQLAQSGRLQRTDPIRLTRLGNWMDAGSMVGLFPDETAATNTELEPEPLPESQPRRQRDSSVPERPTGDADDWAAAVLSEPGEEPPPRRPAAVPQPREPAAVRPDPTPTSEPPPAAAAAASIAAGMAATAASSAPQRPTFTPPRRSSRKSSSGGRGLSLPSGLSDSLTNPKVLGAVGAVLVAVALFFVPWGSLFTPAADDLITELEAIWGQVKPLYENEAADAEWTRVSGTVTPKLAEIAQEAIDRGAGGDRPTLQIVQVLASQSIPKVLESKLEAKATQIKVVDSFFARLKEG